MDLTILDLFILGCGLCLMGSFLRYLTSEKIEEAELSSVMRRGYEENNKLHSVPNKPLPSGTYTKISGDQDRPQKVLGRC